MMQFEVRKLAAGCIRHERDDLVPVDRETRRIAKRSGGSTDDPQLGAGMGTH